MEYACVVSVRMAQSGQQEHVLSFQGHYNTRTHSNIAIVSAWPRQKACRAYAPTLPRLATSANRQGPCRSTTCISCAAPPTGDLTNAALPPAISTTYPATHSLAWLTHSQKPRCGSLLGPTGRSQLYGNLWCSAMRSLDASWCTLWPLVQQQLSGRQHSCLKGLGRMTGYC